MRRLSEDEYRILTASANACGDNIPSAYVRLLFDHIDALETDLRDERTKAAALRDLETAVLNGDHTCNDRVVPGAARGDYCAICRALEDSAALAAKEE